jgi:stage II sporulation protein D (peptidoglycan lytic transglycosylase)
MICRAAVRIVISALAVGGIALGGVRPMPPVNALSSQKEQVRSTIRVGVWTLWHDREIVLTPASGLRHSIVRTCERCEDQPLAHPTTIRAEGNAVAVTSDGKTTNSAGLWLAGAISLAAHGETITLQNPVAITACDGVLTIAVTLPTESYVERVVASESGAADSAETMKALAVVVRTYALHEAHGHRDYDVCDSTHCQHLRWSEDAQRRNAADAATLATAGETLWFRGRRALAYFSKDCGGRTASPAEVWIKAKATAYLPSHIDRFCTGREGAEWASELNRAQIAKALAARGIAAPGWQQLAVARRGESGRAVTLRLDKAEIAAEDFRLAIGEAMGWNKIPSTWFEISRQGETFFFHGRGWGHGVGLCQKGAAAMGAQGRGATEILDQYFPGAERVDEATGRAWKRIAGSGVVLESLDDSDAEYLRELERARAEASRRSGLNATASFTVRAFVSTRAFREATLEPGWVAAFAQGDAIATQPLRTLAARRLLAATTRHEFLHALIEGEAGSKAPLWLREGLAEGWGTDDSGRSASSELSPPIKVEALDAALMRAASEAESEAAHRAAGWYAAQLLDRYGRAQVLEWLRSGIPGGVVAALGQR